MHISSKLYRILTTGKPETTKSRNVDHVIVATTKQANMYDTNKKLKSKMKGNNNLWVQIYALELMDYKRRLEKAKPRRFRQPHSIYDIFI